MNDEIQFYLWINFVWSFRKWLWERYYWLDWFVCRQFGARNFNARRGRVSTLTENSATCITSAWKEKLNSDCAKMDSFSEMITPRKNYATYRLMYLVAIEPYYVSPLFQFFESSFFSIIFYKYKFEVKLH